MCAGVEAAATQIKCLTVHLVGLFAKVTGLWQEKESRTTVSEKLARRNQEDSSHLFLEGVSQKSIEDKSGDIVGFCILY